ncbi:MAG: DedA family protein [Gemmatimonadaceae bacterium]
MLRWIVDWVASMSYWGVGLLMAIENVVLPLPSELIMPLSGYLSSQGRMSLWGVIAAGTIGSVLGALPLYYVARRVGRDRVTAWVDRHGKWVLVRGRDLERANARFAGNNFTAVAVSQIIPGVRGLVALPAGFARMNVLMFLLANFAGTIVWCGVLAIAGHVLGANFARVHKFLGPIGWAVLAIALLAGIAWGIRRRRQH